MVYFIEEKGTNYVKIGFSQDRQSVDYRVKSLQTGNPRELSLMFCFDAEVEDERYFHERYDKFRLKGEWFDIKEKLNQPDVEDKIRLFLNKRIQKRKDLILQKQEQERKEKELLKRKNQINFKHIEYKFIQFATENNSRRFDYYEIMREMKREVRKSLFWNRVVKYMFNLVYPNKFECDIEKWEVQDFDFTNCIRLMKKQQEKENLFLQNRKTNVTLDFDNVSARKSEIESMVIGSLKNGTLKKSEICQEQGLTIHEVNMVWRNPLVQQAINK